MRRLLRLLAFGPVLLLAGCGGGVWLGVCDGCDDGDDDPPSVALVVSPSQVRSGDTVRLAAAASDDFAVREVEFYRLDALGNALRLDTDTIAPYELDTTIPAGSAGTTVRYFARAIDDRRQRTDSATASVSVLP